MMENKEKKKKDNWIRLASKTHPGRFYMFNKATGETEWLPIKKDSPEGENKIESAPKLNRKWKFIKFKLISVF